MTAQQLLAEYQPGHALAQDFYANGEIFAQDLELLTRRWHCAGHVSELPQTGDYKLADLAREQAVITRAADGNLHAMANVCRHRGSRVCVKPHGRANILTCPYHAWTYTLDGSLRQASQMPEGFDPTQHGLKKLPLAVVGGLIFIAFDDAPPDIAPGAAALTAMTSRYGWETARVAARKHYTVSANWKLAMENYHECYHCGPAHPEFSVLHALARPGMRRITAQDREAWSATSHAAEVFRVMNSVMSEGCETGSKNGKPIAKLMGQASYDGECVFAELGFLSAFLAYPDYGVIYRFIPRDTLHTEMEVIWLVAGDAVEGQDYTTDALTWLWDVTSIADKTIIERNQAGVLSRAYTPGPFSLMEPGTRQYVERYVAEMRDLLA